MDQWGSEAYNGSIVHTDIGIWKWEKTFKKHDVICISLEVPHRSARDGSLSWAYGKSA